MNDDIPCEEVVVDVDYDVVVTLDGKIALPATDCD